MESGKLGVDLYESSPWPNLWGGYLCFFARRSIWWFPVNLPGGHTFPRLETFGGKTSPATMHKALRINSCLHAFSIGRPALPNCKDLPPRLMQSAREF